MGNKRKERKAGGGLQVLPTLQVLERTTWVPGGNSHIKSIVVPVRNFEKKPYEVQRSCVVGVA